MGYAQTQTPSNSHLYSQELQLKLYQAFIFSIPILFSIILFLLFYLFYLKKRSYPSASSPRVLPRTLNQASPLAESSEMDLKGNLTDKLLSILFDGELSTKNSQCCVCLGEFEMKEELHQIPSCKHVFHADCIRHWIQSNSTCPLCRCSVFGPTTTTTIPQNGHRPNPPVGPGHVVRIDENSNRNLPVSVSQEQLVSVDSTLNNCSGEHVGVVVEGSSSTGTSYCMENEMCDHPNEQSVVLTIQIHDT